MSTPENLKPGNQLGLPYDQINDKEFADEQITDEQITDEQITDDQITDDQITDDQIDYDDQTADDQIVDDQLTEDQIISNRIPDNQMPNNLEPDSLEKDCLKPDNTEPDNLELHNLQLDNQEPEIQKPEIKFQIPKLQNMNSNMNYKFQVACNFVQAHFGLGKDRTVYLDGLCRAIDKMEYIYERNKEWRMFSTRGVSDIFIKKPYQAIVMVMAKDSIDEVDEDLYRKWKYDINSPVFLVNFGQENGPEFRAYI